jgi:glucose 1-dehydrogenase
VERFSGKVALVTGASRGIGRGIALHLAREGANVIINYRTHPEEAQSLAQEIAGMGRQALLQQADVADREAMAAMFAAAQQQFGHIDVVVANAAYSVREPVVNAAWEGVLRTLEVTQFGVFHACQMAAQQMVKQGKGGKILLISSIHEEVPFANSAAYNMAKAAINHLARTLANELTPHHINVNVINPGWIDTPGERNFSTEEQLQEGGKHIPWGRLGTPEDVAAAAAFLCSDEADYITGSTLRVDGGFMLGMTLP